MESAFLEKAGALAPRLHHTRVRPRRTVDILPAPRAPQGLRAVTVLAAGEIPGTVFANGDRMVLDFGRHLVGRPTFRFSPVGGPQDSPLRLRLVFGENLCEIADTEDYHGSLSSSWLQEEIVNVDCIALPCTLPRRYAFRYLSVEMIGTRTAYRARLDEVYATAETSADVRSLRRVSFRDPLLQKIDRIGCATLRDCMQSVFEDGPKRDRRLWIGDLRLQALANYETYDDLSLVRRCLYLFAGLPREDGRVSVCIFHEPVLQNDPWVLWDYALFFIGTLYDYYKHTGDREFLRELWPTARRQAELVLGLCGDDGLFEKLSVFVDWQRALHKRTAAHGIAVRGLSRAAELARELEDPCAGRFAEAAEKIGRAAVNAFYRPAEELFASGEEEQFSFASQVWMVLSGALEPAMARRVMERTVACASRLVPMMTPYMHHYYMEALLAVGLKEEALAHLRTYWGKMARWGADCFWETFDPDDADFSTYGDRRMNSYCHAWSCTASYFLRKYFPEEMR